GDFDPSRECFMADLADEQNDNAPSNDGDGGADAQANPPVVPLAAPSSSSSAARQAQLAQAAGRVARERILADDNVDKSPKLKTAGEKLVAAAYLLQAMP